MWFVGYILAHRWTDALPYPSLRQMSRRTGISTQMLHRYKQSLVEKGYLATIPRHRPSGGRTSNSYDFSGLFARLEQLLRRDRRDPAWQPTADESEEQEQDAGVPQAVPPSQQPAPPDGVLLQGHPSGGRQRALSAPAQPSAAGAGRTGLPAGAPPPSPAPVIPTGPQESRSLSSKTRTTRSSPGQAPRRPKRDASGNGRGVRNEGTSDERENEETNGGRRTGERATNEGNEQTNGTERQFPPSASAGPLLDPADARWASACRILAAELTPAAVSAWLRPLTPVALAPAPDRGGQLLVLACNTAFHRDHVLRRYRAAIERAAGAACEVVVRPAQPESGTQVAPQPPGSAPAPASPRPALALAPAPSPALPPALRR